MIPEQQVLAPVGGPAARFLAGWPEQAGEGQWAGRCSHCVPTDPWRRARPQVSALSWRVCKTVGSAYVGSNPTPATRQNPRSAYV